MSNEICATRFIRGGIMTLLSRGPFDWRLTGVSRQLYYKQLFLMVTISDALFFVQKKICIFHSFDMFVC